MHHHLQVAKQSEEDPRKFILLIEYLQISVTILVNFSVHKYYEQEEKSLRFISNLHHQKTSGI